MDDILALDDARSLVTQTVTGAIRLETVPLAAAGGRFLGMPFAADTDWPTTDRSAMDGFALSAGPEGARPAQRFRVVGEALAGHPFEGELGPGEAVRIMTGGVVPTGATTVAMVEHTSGYAGDTVEVLRDVAAGANIRRRGEEVAAGTPLLAAGRRIAAAEVAALAVLGVVEVPVAVRPRLAVLATGDEVVDAGSSPAPHQVRDSNSWALAARAAELGATARRLGTAADREDALRAALADGLEDDVLVTIGGISKGTHDLVHGTLAALGVETLFHGIALKPGKPTFFGRRARADGGTTWVFGLPGNPASAFTTFELFVAPTLYRLAGGAPPPPLSARVAGVPFRTNWRAQAIPARLGFGADGALVAELTALRPSGDPFGLLDGHGFALVPGGAEAGALAAVEVVRYVDAVPVGGGTAG